MTFLYFFIDILYIKTKQQNDIGLRKYEIHPRHRLWKRALQK